MKWVLLLQAASAATATMTAPNSLDITRRRSVQDVAASLAFDSMSYYTGNTSSVPKDMGDLQDPYYWWVAGALWGAMIDYYHYTEDASYNDVVIEALLAKTNLGVNADYMPAEHADEEGNDDLFFWGSAVLSAAERNFPQPNRNLPSWLDISANVFNSLVSRWNTTRCEGGLTWQISPINPNGMNYKNSVSNGGLFQLSARLARATGNDTYLEWATRVWDWSAKVGFIDEEKYHIYDGTDSATDCSEVNDASFTYTSGIYLYGAAVLANYTEDEEWATRAERLLEGSEWFFSPFDNSTNIMYEKHCEFNYDLKRCSVDASTHKGFLARFMWATIPMMPSLGTKIKSYLYPSAEAAAVACSGGKRGRTCGLRWYLNGYDGEDALGPQMSALETIQGLLIQDMPSPLQGDDIKTVRDRPWDPKFDKSKIKKKPEPTKTETEEKPKPTESEDAASLLEGSMVWASLSVSTVLIILGWA